MSSADQHDNSSEKIAIGALRAWLLELPRFYKRAVLVLADTTLLALAAYIAMSLRYQAFYTPHDTVEALLVIAAPLITITTFAWFGLYRLVTRFIGYRGALRIVACVALAVLIWALIVFMSGQHGIPRTAIFAYAILAVAFINLSRQIARILLETVGIPIKLHPVDADRKPVLIYGAGRLGVQLLRALHGQSERDPIGFIDSEKSMWGQYVGGLKVYRPDKIGAIIARSNVKEILLAIPEGKRRDRRQIHTELQQYPVTVKVLPSVAEIASGQVNMTDVRPIDVQDLLGRDPVPPNPDLLARSIHGKAILVTGAGGSVGSELVRQILKQKPRKLVLLDSSEVALYNIEMEVSELVAAQIDKSSKTDIVTVLGSVIDTALVRDAIANNDIETIYHAAAYKHVPIVERNAIVGLENNTFGCGVVAEAAMELGVDRFVLVSTDKAVRPTNIMGASKRLSELILQAYAAESPAKTVFTMVRFGNVLGSSGSVVQRFRDQISAGGPVTVTHQDIIRYFMSIPEAAELVIQAGAMARGGEVFVLDMGEPVKIDDLARLMIRLAGFEVLDENNPDGDIEIVYSGLRPGEKLYEELLIGADTTSTEHPRIMRTDEPFLPISELAGELDALHNAISERDRQAVEGVLARTVEGYHRPELSDQTEEAIELWSTASRTLH